MKEEILNLLEEKGIKEIIINKFGEKAIEILKELIKRNKEIDLVLTSELGLEANVLRRILYKLYEYRIVDYKEEKKKDIAWIDYYWWVREKELLKFLINELEKLRLEYLKTIEELEHNELFYCPVCKNIYDYSMALNLNFTCPNDGSELLYYDKKEEIINQYKEKLKETSKLLEKVNKILNEAIRLKR